MARGLDGIADTWLGGILQSFGDAVEAPESQKDLFSEIADSKVRNALTDLAPAGLGKTNFDAQLENITDWDLYVEKISTQPYINEAVKLGQNPMRVFGNIGVDLPDLRQPPRKLRGKI